MGSIYTAAGTPGFYPELDEIVLPGSLNDGLVALHIGFAGATAAAKNRADPSKPATIIGAPVTGPGYLDLQSATNYLMLGIGCPLNATLAVVGAGTDTGVDITRRALLLSNYNGGGAQVGASIQMSSPDDLRATGGYGDGAGAYTFQTAGFDPTGEMAKLRSLIATFDNAATALFNMTDQQEASVPPSAGYSRADNGQLLRWGSGAAPNYQGTSRQSMALVWTRVLDADERALLYLWQKALCATVGVLI